MASRPTATSMKRNPSTHARRKFCTRTLRSSSRNAWRKSMTEFFSGSAILRFANFHENIHAARLRDDTDGIGRSLLRREFGHFVRVAMKQMPVDSEFHPAARRIVGGDVRGKEQPAGRGQIVKNLHQFPADRVREVIEKSGAINQVVATPLKHRHRLGVFLHQLMNGLFYDIDPMPET